MPQVTIELPEGSKAVIFPAELVDQLQHIAGQLKTQDNLHTEDPVYVVYDRIPVVVDGEYHSGTTMFKRNDDFEGDFMTREEMEDEIEEYNRHLDEDDEDTLTEYDFEEVEVGDEQVFKEAFFTREAAEAYLVNMSHHLNNAYIYVESASRNSEWRLIRKLLLNY